MKFLYKFLRIIIAFALLPFCVGAGVTLWQIVTSGTMATFTWILVLAGALAWTLIFIFLPEPKWMYVLGHELTHALWSLSMGGRLKKIKVGSNGGHVLITKSNFLTSLAPYFFPFYVLIVILIFAIGNLFWNWSYYVSIFYFLIGFAYAFHVTLTYKTLKIKQPDIRGEGRIFSAVVIFLGNILILIIGISFLSDTTSILSPLNSWIEKSLGIYNYLFIFLQHLINNP